MTTVGATAIYFQITHQNFFKIKQLMQLRLSTQTSITSAESSFCFLYYQKTHIMHPLGQVGDRGAFKLPIYFVVYIAGAVSFAGTVNANQIHMKSSIFYYSDKCNSSKANIQQIQSNFIKALNSSQFSSVCVGEPFCSAEFVNVTCGPTARRRREVAFYERLRRSAHRYAYKVTFDVSVPISSNTSQSKSMVFAMKANLLTQMTMVIDQEIRSGHFDLPVAGLQIESDSFNQGLIEYKCPKGLRAKMASESCSKYCLLYLLLIF